MRKKIKTPKSNMNGLPEICDFEGGYGGETLPPNPFISTPDVKKYRLACLDPYFEGIIWAGGWQFYLKKKVRCSL